MTNARQVLTTSASKETAQNIVQMVFEKIDVIRFAEDFDLLNQTEKSDWLDRAYIQQHPADFEGLSEHAQKLKVEQDRRSVNAWKKQVGRVTTARNRLRALFIQVSGHIALDTYF
jgi:hypothetical protein